MYAWARLARLQIGLNNGNGLKMSEFIVDADHAGIRLDKFLVSVMPDYSRSEIQRFTIMRNGMPARVAEKLRVGDTITVEIPQPQTDIASENISSDFDLDILYEDDDIIVINKPRGVVMYPSAGNKTGTLVQNILAHTHLSALGGQTQRR